MQAVLFYILATLTGTAAVAVVVSQNVVRAATWLLFALAGTAGVYFLLGADFIGATQLLIYVGGTMVLVVFGVMLTAQGPFIKMKIGVGEWAIAAIVGVLFYGILAVCLVGEDAPADTRYTKNPEIVEGRSLAASKYLGVALLGDHGVQPRASITGSEKLADRERKRMGYLLPFEVVSIHLLVVLVGAAYLARAKRRVTTVGAAGEEAAS